MELFTRRAIFAGNDELHQIQTITDRLGPVTSDRWPEAETLPWFELVKAPGSEGAAVEEKQAKEQRQDQLKPDESESRSKGKETSPVEDQISLDEKEKKIFTKALGK